jgi:hypothetical protein
MLSKLDSVLPEAAGATWAKALEINTTDPLYIKRLKHFLINDQRAQANERGL